MLALLLDEMISAVISDQVKARRPDISIQSIHRWRAGAFTQQPDHLILRAAAEENLTLVTYDIRTIRPLVNAWATTGTSHAGVIFIDQHTIDSRDFGGLIRAIELLWEREHQLTWLNRIKFLDRP